MFAPETPTGRIEFYARRSLTGRKQWRWRIVADNGRKVLSGGHQYNRRADAVENAEQVLRVVIRDGVAATVPTRGGIELYKVKGA